MYDCWMVWYSDENMVVLITWLFSYEIGTAIPFKYLTLPLCIQMPQPFEYGTLWLSIILVNPVFESLLYSKDLKSGLVWITDSRKRLDCEWSRSQIGTEIWKPNYLKSNKNHLKSGLVWITDGKKRLDCEWSRSQMGSETPKPNYLKSRQKPFEIWTKLSGFWMIRFLNGWDHSYS